MQFSLKHQLSYARYVQLSIVFMFGMYMYLFTTIPHNWWICLTVLMMMSVIQPGLILARSISRGKGTVVGIILSLLLVYVFHINYRLVSICLIASMLFLFIPNPKRYDLTVTSMTIMVFLTDSYGYKTPLLEGPIEVAINRITCTIIGIAICVASDYILFNRFNYSGKAYRVLQEELIEIVEARLAEITMDLPKRLNRLVIIKKIRDNFNNVFTELIASSSGLLTSHSSSEELKATVREFSDLSWQLRKEISAIYIANCIVVDDEVLLQKHLAKLEELLVIARKKLLVV